eukprot:gene12563-8610_t
MSKIPPAQLMEAIQAVLTSDKPRKFKESIDLQVNLKNYDPQKDKRFSGSVRLPHVCRPRMTVCLLCDLVHEDVAKKVGVPTMNQEELKKLNKNKKLVKKMCNQYDAFLCSESIIKTVPRLVGPHMHRMGKFPTVCGMNEPLQEKIQELQSTVKFQLKKVLCLGTCVGHLELNEDQVRQNITMALNFFVSLLKKNWQNLKSAYIKSTMGKPQRIY